jgi:hypothetical protein
MLPDDPKQSEDSTNTESADTTSSEEPILAPEPKRVYGSQERKNIVRLIERKK